jgi:hypothetical protein
MGHSLGETTQRLKTAISTQRSARRRNERQKLSKEPKKQQPRVMMEKRKTRAPHLTTLGLSLSPQYLDPSIFAES